MTGFRYQLEQNLIIGCSAGAIFGPDELDDVARGSDLSRAKIYMFVSRPLLIVHESGSSALFGPTDEPSIRLSVSGMTFESYAGGQKVRFVDSDGNVQFDGRASMLLQELFRFEDPSNADVNMVRAYLDSEVLYVGKSDDDRGVIGRLKSHSTLQKILAQYMANHPDRELWILALVFNVTNTLGVLTGGSSESDAPIESRLPAAQPVLSETQMTSLAEGALIRYFAPSFNDRLKETFPSRSHQSYLDAVAYDFNSYGFVLSPESLLGMRLGSGRVPMAPIHEESFPIDSAETRMPLTMQAVLEINASARSRRIPTADDE